MCRREKNTRLCGANQITRFARVDFHSDERVAKVFRFRSRILALVLALSVNAVVLPERATAVEAPTPQKTYVAFFLGQGGYIFSWGIPYLDERF
jgi:hypothetical protein